jgi:SAM-dependent methyltransferase
VLRVAQFRQGDAMAQPFPDDTFDVAVMPLVIFFVPDPAKGVAEMARVVCPGGTVTAYAWDMLGGGFPYEALQVEMRGMGLAVPAPPSPGASRMDAMRDLWTGAGLDAIEAREITVQRTFPDFDDYWTTIFGSPSVGPKLAAMASEDLALLKARMRTRLPADAAGRITYSARANAVKGRVPNESASRNVQPAATEEFQNPRRLGRYRPAKEIGVPAQPGVLQGADMALFPLHLPCLAEL